MTSLRSDLYQRMIAHLVEARKARGITQVELGALIKQRQTFISKIEQCERRLDAAEFIMVCRAIGVEPYELMKRAEEVPLPSNS